ncbi:unnamed protein product [Hyaloperonospora brassicae]|uniref:CCHC-type domain-containing protein n=1 Tax=Hyaloperonospora brassicae TaxID=162125 RepID=A0AAV0U112_HYABA|nr:unnamed protein product [Hyaloperonospora brassicae]
MAKYDTSRTDHLEHAEALAHFAQSIELDACSSRSFGRDVVSHVVNDEPRKETCICHGCGKVGHLKRDCQKKEKKPTGRPIGSRTDGANLILSIDEDPSSDSSV